MRLYHYMDRTALRHLMAKGHIIGYPSASQHSGFAEAYGWLADRMVERLGPPPPHARRDWPVFAWKTFDGSDFFSNQAALEVLDADYMVGFDVPEGLALLSDFDDWHHVLNNFYLPASIDEEGVDREFAAFDRKAELAGYSERGHPPESGPVDHIENERRGSWERIFDHAATSTCVQASLWELRWEWAIVIQQKHPNSLTGDIRTAAA